MEKILHENSEKILKSNIEILFGNLSDAIKKYVDDGEWMGELKYINAYLSATIHDYLRFVNSNLKINFKIKNGHSKQSYLKICKLVNDVRLKKQVRNKIPVHDVFGWEISNQERT